MFFRCPTGTWGHFRGAHLQSMRHCRRQTCVVRRPLRDAVRHVLGRRRSRGRPRAGPRRRCRRATQADRWSPRRDDPHTFGASPYECCALSATRPTGRRHGYLYATHEDHFGKIVPTIKNDSFERAKKTNSRNLEPLTHQPPLTGQCEGTSHTTSSWCSPCPPRSRHSELPTRSWPSTTSSTPCADGPPAACSSGASFRYARTSSRPPRRC